MLNRLFGTSQQRPVYMAGSLMITLLILSMTVFVVLAWRGHANIAFDIWSMGFGPLLCVSAGLFIGAASR